MNAEPVLLESDPKFWTKTSWLQLFYGLWVNLTTVSIGLIFGFSAVAVPQFKKTIEMTVEQEATITSMISLAAPIGCMISGIVQDRFGRKLGLMLCQIPVGFGWFYMAMASQANNLIVGRVISGIGLGMAMGVARAYTTEITLPNMRGVVGTIPNIAISLGITIQACLGTFLEWKLLCYLCGGYAVILLIINMFLPQTPYDVLLKTTASNAHLILSKFRSKSYNVLAEINELKEYQTANNIRRLTFRETIKKMLKPSSCKPFSIVLFYITLGQCSGVNVVMWAVDILQNARSSVDANVGNILLAVTRIAGGLLATWLLFKFGRRSIAISGAVGLGLSSILLGMYLYTINEKTLCPLLLFILYTLFATLTYNSLPFLMMYELLPLQVRGILSGILLTVFNLMSFAMNQIFPILRNNIGLANVLTGYGVISILGAIILFLILPETKGLTLQEIEEYFNDRRPTLVSQRQVRSLQLRSLQEMPGESEKSIGDRGNKHRKSRDKVHDRKRDKSRDRVYDNEDNDNKDYDKNSDKYKKHDKDYDKNNDKYKNHDKDYDKNSDKYKNHDKDYDKTSDKYKNHDKDYDKTSDKYKNHDKDYDKTSDKYRDKGLDNGNENNRDKQTRDDQTKDKTDPNENPPGSSRI